MLQRAKSWSRRHARPVWQVAWSFRTPANRGARCRAAGRTLRYEIKTVALKRPTIAPVGDHSRIICYPGETNSRFAVYSNPPNWPDMYVWRNELKPGDLFLDIGANIGSYSVFAADLGANVIAVEPSAHNAARLRENLALNGYTAEVVEKAVTDRIGRVRMTDDLDSCNHLVADGGGVEVEATTLDDLLGDRIAAGVKIDVEGAERQVLEGAARALREHRIRLIQIEWAVGDWMGISDDRSDVADLLRAAGYDTFHADDHGRLRPVGEQPPLSVNRFAVPVSSLSQP